MIDYYKKKKCITIKNKLRNSDANYIIKKKKKEYSEGPRKRNLNFRRMQQSNMKYTQI